MVGIARPLQKNLARSFETATKHMKAAYLPPICALLFYLLLNLTTTRSRQFHA
jgi:hypothetical protein